MTRSRFLLIFLFLGMISITLGMALKNILPFSPTFGWLFGILFFLASTLFAWPRKRNP